MSRTRSRRCPASIAVTGSAIALIGTLGERCCEPGHARVFVDGRETVDGTGIWQNKSSSGRSLPRSVLFAWRWPQSRHAHDSPRAGRAERKGGQRLSPPRGVLPRLGQRSELVGCEHPVCGGGVLPHLVRRRRAGDHGNHSGWDASADDREVVQRPPPLGCERFERRDAIERLVVDALPLEPRPRGGRLPAPVLAGQQAAGREGNTGTKPTPSSTQSGSKSASAPRSSRLYWFCRTAIGAVSDRLAQLLRREVRDSEPPNLARVDELLHRTRPFPESASRRPVGGSRGCRRSPSPRRSSDVSSDLYAAPAPPPRSSPQPNFVATTARSPPTGEAHTDEALAVAAAVGESGVDVRDARCERCVDHRTATVSRAAGRSCSCRGRRETTAQGTHSLPSASVPPAPGSRPSNAATAGLDSTCCVNT